MYRITVTPSQVRYAAYLKDLEAHLREQYPGAKDYDIDLSVTAMRHGFAEYHNRYLDAKVEYGQRPAHVGEELLWRPVDATEADWVVVVAPSERFGVSGWLVSQQGDPEPFFAYESELYR